MNPVQPVIEHAPLAERIGAPTRRNAPQRGRASFVASVGIALALNAFVVAAVAVSVQRWRAPANPPRQASWVTAVVAARSVSEHGPADTPPASRAAAPLQKTAPTPPSTASASAPKAPPSQSEYGSDVRFYKYREVDRTAEPEPDSDWNLDAAVLDAANVQALVFEVFISATGEIIACTIVEPSGLTADTRRLLEDRLRRTALQPAIRGGVAVASVRRIEISVQSFGP